MALTSGARATKERRTAFFNKWGRRRRELAASEAALHASLHEDVEAVVHAKQILLFKEMLER